MIPTSVAAGFSLLLDCAPATAVVPTDTSASTAHSAPHRTFVIAVPPRAPVVRSVVPCDSPSCIRATPDVMRPDVEVEQLVGLLRGHARRDCSRRGGRAARSASCTLEPCSIATNPTVAHMRRRHACTAASADNPPSRIAAISGRDAST